MSRTNYDSTLRVVSGGDPGGGVLTPEPGLPPGQESAWCGLGKGGGRPQASGKPGGGGASLTSGFRFAKTDIKLQLYLV